MNQAPPPAPDVKEALERWRPTTWTDAEVRILDPLLPILRQWVEKVKPADAHRAVRYLRTAAQIAVWASQTLGTTDPTVVLHPQNVEHWSMTVNNDMPLGWRENKRGALRALGRANNPADWPHPTRKVGKSAIAAPYTPREEKAFRLAATLPGRHDRSRRLWVVAAALGAGLKGTELAMAQVGDLVDIPDGRLAVRVRGNDARLVPIRNDYTDLARSAASGSRSDQFVAPGAFHVAGGPPAGGHTTALVAKGRRAAVRQHSRRAARPCCDRHRRRSGVDGGTRSMTVKQHPRWKAIHNKNKRNRLRPNLPKDHPSRAKRYPKKSCKRLARRILRVIDSSPLVGELNKRLRDHPGRPSRLNLRVLLLGTILNAEDSDRYLRTGITSIFAGLDHRLGVELGMWTLDQRTPITHTITNKQIKRTENALLESWETPEGNVRSLDWYSHTFISHTIPQEVKPMITTVDLDWTPIKAHAVTKDHRNEEEVRQQQEPENTGAIGTLDQRGRLIRSVDPDARSGWATATNKTSAEPFTGYYGHTITVARRATWSGNPDKIHLEEALPPFIAYAKAVPANNDNAANGVHAVLAAREIFPNLKEVICDRGYTVYGEDFVRPVHQLGINVAMDYNKGQKGRIDPVEVGKGKNMQTLLLNCGTFFPWWLPQKWHLLPEHLAGEDRQKWHADRVKYRWVPIAKLADGSIRFMCPQCAGRIKTSAKTWKYRNRPSEPHFDVPHIGNIDDEYCCRGTVTIHVDKLDTYQDIPYGTPAWHQRYAGRLRGETTNSMLKDKGALKLGSCRAMGLAANHLALLAYVVAHNLREVKGYQYNQRLIEDTSPEPPEAEPPSTPTSGADNSRAPP